MVPAIDHIIVLVPHATLHSLPTSLTSAFTVTPGGTHADGLTENKLIIFSDGSYIELIAFLPSTSPSARDAHWWGRKKAGTIDFALTSPSLPAAFPAAYDAPQAGGRTRPDGTEVKWVVTFPSAAFERGAIPFWCHDMTPRALRVPVDAEKTTHPSGAVGVSGLTVRVPAAAFAEAVKVYAELMGVAPLETYPGNAASFTFTTVAKPEETVEVKVVRGKGDSVTFDELVVRGGGDGASSSSHIDLVLDGESFRIRTE